MIRTTVRVSLALLSLVLAIRAWPQTSSPLTTQDLLYSALADLRGMGEGGQLDHERLPAAAHSPAETVSARRLRHQVPKAALQAYDRAVGSQDARQAANELENAIKIDPDFAEAHHALGAFYAHQRRNPVAAAEFRRTIELIPEESLPYSNLAWVLFAMGQHSEAETNVRRALQLSAENARAHLLMGCLLIETPQTLAEGLWHLEYAARTIPEATRLVETLKKK